MKESTEIVLVVEVQYKEGKGGLAVVCFAFLYARIIKHKFIPKRKQIPSFESSTPCTLI